MARLSPGILIPCFNKNILEKSVAFFCICLSLPDSFWGFDSSRPNFGTVHAYSLPTTVDKELFNEG